MKQTPTLRTVHRIFFNLQALDGRDDQAPTRNQKGEIVPTPPTKLKPYKFEEKARWAIARNLRRFGQITEDFEATRKKVFRDHAGEASELVAGTAEHTHFTDAIERLLDEKTEVDAFMIAAADLKVEENGIPGSVLGALDELIVHKEE